MVRKWEYCEHRVQHFTEDGIYSRNVPDVDVAAYTQLGADGWELVSVVELGAFSCTVAVFKRRLSAKPKLRAESRPAKLPTREPKSAKKGRKVRDSKYRAPLRASSQSHSGPWAGFETREGPP
jgi:hypothetical protein